MIIGRRTVLGGLGAATASALLPGSPALAQAQTIDIGTMGVGSTWYQYGVMLSQYFKRNLPDNSVVNVRPYAAADGNLRLIEANDRIQIGMTFSTNIAWAKSGMTDVSDATAENVRLIAAGLDQYYVGMAAPASMAHDTISAALDAGEKLTISTLSPGSLGEIGTMLVLRAHGLDEAAFNARGGTVNRVGIQAASEAVVTGRADVWINPISRGHPRMTELAISHDIKILGLSDEAMAKMAEFGFTPTVLPAGTFNGQDADVMLPGTSTTLIVNEAMSDETAYQVTKALIDNLDAIKSENASLSGLTVQKAADSSLAGGLELHPGAIRAYKEAGAI